MFGSGRYPFCAGVTHILGVLTFASDMAGAVAYPDKDGCHVCVVESLSMHVLVRFFAVHREATGQSSYVADVPAGTRVRDALRLVAHQFPALGGHASGIAFAVNQTVVSDDFTLHDGDELALLPPMAGG